MKTANIVFSILLTLANLTTAQPRDAVYDAHENLIGGRWTGEGSWGDDTPFRQEIEYKTGLSGQIIKTQTWGNVSTDGFEFGLRNEGVRAWSEEESAMLFWEFNVFDGITEGRVEAEGKDLYLHYTYDFGSGPTELTDAWLYQDEDSYEFVVGVYRYGEWKQKFLSIIMKRTE